MSSIIKYITNTLFGNTNKDELNELNEKYNNTDINKLKYFSFNGLTFYAKTCNIYDGDTFTAIFEYRGEIIKYRCRSMGYDSPEIKPLKSIENREEEIMMAHKAKDRLIELLNKHPTKLVKIDCFDFDKYGRILVNIWNMVDTKSINDIMVEEGYGKVYLGGTKE